MKSRLQKLRELRRLVNYEDAHFDHILDDGDISIPRGQVTTFIRWCTRFHRESWINPIIDELIAAEEQKRARRRRRP